MWWLMYACTSKLSAHVPGTRREKNGDNSHRRNRTHLSQAVMVQMRTRMAQDAILPRTPTVNQTNRPVVVRMQTPMTETGSTWRFGSDLEMRLRQQCGRAMLLMLPRVSVAVARMQVQAQTQGALSVTVLMMMQTHCSADWRKESLPRRPPLRILMVVVVVTVAGRL